MTAFAVIISLIGVLAAVYIAAPLAGAASSLMRRLATIALVVSVSGAALGVYLVGGQPGAPGQPYAAVAERLAEADPASLTLAEQEERLRSILRETPGDATAHALLGRLLARTGRELEAVASLDRSLRIQTDARTFSDLGQVLVTMNEGAVTPEARRAFMAAHQADSSLPEPAFFLGAADYEAGDRSSALNRWAEVLEQLAEDDPYRLAIAQRAADLLSRPSVGPIEAGEGDAPFAALGEGDAEAMISAMLSGLTERLEADPSDISGWLTLARAQAMRGEAEAAATAITRAAGQTDAGSGERLIVAALAAALQLDLEESEA
ncbi:MAG: hypothetical protein AAFX09_00205 [Pseudomonadota bacterium]